MGYIRNVTVGMIFAFLAAGVTEAFLFPKGASLALAGTGLKGSLKGLLLGSPLNLCSACIVPITNAFRRRGAGVETSVAVVQGSSTLNPLAMIMIIIVFSPVLAGSRIGLSLIGALLIGPIVAMAVGQRRQLSPQPIGLGESLTGGELATWRRALAEGSRDWMRSSFGFLITLGPIMVVAGFASGLAIQWISPQTVQSFLGDSAQGVLIAATLGVLINVPLLFEIPLVVLLLLLGMGTAPAATLLFTAAAAGPITYWGLARVIPKRGIVTFGVATWALGISGGLGVLFLGPDPGLEVLALKGRSLMHLRPSEPVTPFNNVADTALRPPISVFNNYPGVAIFDYDRDGDLDFYITNYKGHANFLYRNNGDGTFTDVAKEAGVQNTEGNGTGVVACDINNDGFQDLYVGNRGEDFDGLDFRSPQQGNVDRLFLNNRDGTFTDITFRAFGDAINPRSAMSIACADVDNDGWIDIYVGNHMDSEWVRFDSANFPGHYNLLYRNNGDLTFTEMAKEAGVQGPQILMRDPKGKPILFEDPATGVRYEGYDPTLKDAKRNRVGEPTGQTFAILFFDYDDDGDPDLWVANDGDRLHVYRNDSTPGQVRFTPVAHEMGIDRVGAWMGFAVGDYDGDGDLDVFVTNAGFHPRLKAPPSKPGADCAYHERFSWGTCLHALLRNDGTRMDPVLGAIGVFRDVASSTFVRPSPIMPPDSLDRSKIHPSQKAPSGLAAYDFGFGATFFDYDNDGDQDLYWLGSIINRGEAPGGELFPMAGRMLRGDGKGSFEDITVEAHLLDILGVDYSVLDPKDPGFDPRRQRISPEFHENGKGVAHGDLNGDGYVDLIGTNSSGDLWNEGRDGLIFALGPLFLWINGGGENHWITLRLKGRMAIDGTGSNADGIGARVYVKSKETDKRPLVQVQELRAGSSYLSMDSIDLEFGLGKATNVEEITIRWPSGRNQVLKDVKADQVLVITEPER